MMPIFALDDLPESALRAVRKSYMPLLNLRGYISQFNPRRGQARDDIERFARDLPDAVMSTLAPALALHQARLSMIARSFPTYVGSEGSWSVLAPLGQGGQGAVSRAWNSAKHMAGALKVVRPDAWRNKEVLTRRLKQEKDKLDELRHPNILQLLDYGEDPEPFIVTQIASFGTLQEWLPTLRGDIVRVIALSYSAARGLKHAHDRGVIHRDIKPSNLFLISPDAAAVGDFGILRSVQQEQELTIAAEGLVGDASFAPPEAHDGDYVPELSFDIFCLGATMHCAFKGERPRRPYWRAAGDDYEHLSTFLGSVQFAAIDDLIKSMLSKRPGERPAIGQVCHTLSGLSTLSQGSRRKREYCPQCGGPAAKMQVDGFHLQGQPKNERPDAWRCKTCGLVAFYLPAGLHT